MLLQVLEAQGQSIVAPSERSGLHPLVVPLSSGSDKAEGGDSITGLLRWPDSTSRVRVEQFCGRCVIAWALKDGHPPHDGATVCTAGMYVWDRS